MNDYSVCLTSTEVSQHHVGPMEFKWGRLKCLVEMFNLIDNNW